MRMLVYRAPQMTLVVHLPEAFTYLTHAGGGHPGLGGDLNVLLAFTVVIAVIMIRPAGLFGRQSVVRA